MPRRRRKRSRQRTGWGDVTVFAFHRAPAARRACHIAYRVAEMLVSVVSRLYNAAFLGGSTHQTTSARAHVDHLPRHRAAINALFFWQEDHCRKAWQQEVHEAKRTLAMARRRE